MDNKPGLAAKIEKMSMSYIMSSPGDPGALADIRSILNETLLISGDACENGYKNVDIALRSLDAFIDKGVKEGRGWPELCGVIEKTLSGLQLFMNGSMGAADIVFPAELGMASGQENLNKAMNEVHSSLCALSLAASINGAGPVSTAAIAAAAVIEKYMDGQKPGNEEMEKAVNNFVRAAGFLSNAEIPCFQYITGPAGAREPEIRDMYQAGAVMPPGTNKDGNDRRVLTADISLLKDFINEAKEHTNAADSQLLALERDNNSEDAINTIFRCFHTLKSLSSFLELQDIFTLVKEVEGMLHKVRKKEIVINGPVMDLMFESVDMLKKQVNNLKEAVMHADKMIIEPGLDELVAKVRAICGMTAGPDPVAGPKLGETLLKNGKITEEQLNESLAEQRNMGEPAEKLGEILIKNSLVTGIDITNALQEQRAAAVTACSAVKETVKIDSDKLDSLIDTIGEIVISESMINNEGALLLNGSSGYLKNLSHLNKTTKRLHELGLSLRLIPLNSTFQKMARLVRDLSRKHNKRVDFITSGEDTEIDRSVVEKISDPLVHMLRNAVDHGIETTEDRKRAGKAAIATVKLSAYHRSGKVYIEVSDDGRGLDREMILARGIETGFIKEALNYQDNEVFNLIFRPGFSTASVITDTSGRGVGMDVVKRNIESLHGRVDIETEKGKGTKFTISMPLTTAIIEAMVVRVNDDKYLIPTLSIVESVKAENNISMVGGKGILLSLREELIPVFSLSRLFYGSKDDHSSIDGRIIVIVDNEAGKAGIVVDELIDQQQIVVKSIGNGMGRTEGIGGCTIMSDGKVGLIIDISTILKFAVKGEEVKR